MYDIRTILTLAPMILMFGAGLCPDRHKGDPGNRLLGTQSMAWLALIISLFAALTAVACGPMSWNVPLLPQVYVSVYFDNLTAILLVLVSFLGAIVLRYAQTSMSRHQRYGSFRRWLFLTIGSVIGLLIAGNLLMFTVAWMATSLSLHQLLTFNSERTGAILAARKKFLISRLGDISLLGALVVCWRIFHTWNFATIFQAAAAMAANGHHPPSIALLDTLLVLAACLKSAQFPFHSWLPQTMETPTPVSALMHAGIINAGGYLVIRLSPLLMLCPRALAALAFTGAATALFGSTVMMAQTSIKRSLAFSTVGQMGFMMLECGLGAFSLATLHLVAHSLYKAHAFLSSGSTLGRGPLGHHTADYPPKRNLAAPNVFQIAILPLLAVSWLVMQADISTTCMPLLAVALVAFARLFWLFCRQAESLLMPVVGILSVLTLAAVYRFLGLGIAALLGTSLPPDTHAVFSPLPLLPGMLVLFMVAAAWIQIALCSPPRSDKARAFYVHVTNGFYIETIANRIVTFLWPQPTAQDQQVLPPESFKESLYAPDHI